jgi:MFS superfamily sulfate permease-like transporter
MAMNPAAGWKRRLPFQSLRGETLGGFGVDLIAGLTLAAIAVPEQMATARLGGFAPEVGFFALAAASVGFAAFGASRRLSAGADSTITPIFAGSLGLMAASGSPHYFALAAVLALMVGGMVALAGLFRMGWVADLLSTPVLTGFLAGIALHIALSQAPLILGLPEGSGDAHHRLMALVAGAGAFNGPSLAIGAGVFAVIFAAEKLSPRIPGALIAVIGAAMATSLFNLGQHGVAVLGHVPGGIPSLVLPSMVLDDVPRLLGLAVVLSLVVMVQTGATTRAFAGEDRDPDVNRDYIGVGLGGVLAGLFGAFPVNASPPRTAIVTETGGHSQYAGLAAALVVLLLAAFGAGLLTYVPTAALAGVLLFVAQRIFHAATFAELMRRAPSEFGLALLTLVLIVALPIQTGVTLGMVLSLIHGVFTTTRARPILFEHLPDSTIWWPAPSADPQQAAATPVLVMGFQAPLSFLNAYDFRRGILDAVERRAGATGLLVLEASSIVEIDFTASKVLLDVIRRTRASGMDFAVARLESVRAQTAFDRFGVTALLGEDHLFRSVDAAVRTLGDAQDQTMGLGPHQPGR